MSEEAVPAIVVTDASSPGITADGRIVLHLEDADQGIYECSLTRAAAVHTALLILWRLGELPATSGTDEPQRMAIEVAGSAEITIGVHTRTPSLLFNMNGVKAGIRLSATTLRQLQRELDAALTQITAAAGQTTAH